MRTKIFLLSIFMCLAMKTVDARLNFASRVTVSGISAGGFMANQMHIAHSDMIQGAAMLASGPYFCSRANILTALSECMNRPQAIPSGSSFFMTAKKFEDLGLIDSLTNLKDDKIFFLSGRFDQTVMPQVVDENVAFYQAAGLKQNAIKYVSNFPVGHALPTLNYGNRCETPSQSPWISSCDYDSAKDLLQHLFGNLNQPTKLKQKNFFQFHQPRAPSMNDKGYAYIPSSCQQGQTCELHVSFHGCRQTVSLIGETYFKNTGLNEWAETNNIVVVYPQVDVDEWLGNPRGCWDWWGYSGVNFATKDGQQISSIKKIIDSFVDQSIELEILE